MSEGYQKQGPGKPQGFPGLSSDPRKFSTGGRWALWNGRCETAGALCAPLRKDRRGPLGAASSRPKSLPPTGGRCHGICRDGWVYPRPCPEGFCPAGRNPFGILRINGRGKPRPYVKTRAARGKRRTMRTPTQRLKGSPGAAPAAESLPPTGGRCHGICRDG